MKVVFYAADKPREHILARALEEGVRNVNVDFELRRTADYGESEEGEPDRRYPGPTPDTDVAVVFGVKGRSREILRDHRGMGKTVLYLDKGYTREKGPGGHTLYSRVSINASTPVAYMLRRSRKGDRLKRLGLKMNELRPPRAAGHILFCGSSAKYHEFNGLDDPTAYATKTLDKIRKVSKRHLIYRPKPSWTDAIPIPGASLSLASSGIEDALRGCHCVVTHGSSAAIDAIFAGIPALVLGDGAARPVSETDIEKIERPTWAADEPRYRWACALAYCQWTTEELRSGEAWSDLREDFRR